MFDRENENEEKPKEEQLDEDELYENSHGKEVFLKPAAEHPNHKWIAMWETWRMVCDWCRKASYTDPDNFKMYIYNDFHCYGIQELIENLVSID